jgi:hypothetical protein
VNIMANHEQGLERDHDFVISYVVANEDEDGSLGHRASRRRRG